MLIQFDQQIVVITGGASGIGRACADLFRAGGATVLVLDRAGREPQTTGEEPGALHYYACDLAQPDQIAGTFDQIGKQFGRINVLVNNAGIQSYGNLAELTEEGWDQTLAINTKAYFLCAKYALPLLMATSTPVIINVASVKTQVCQDRELAYVTSKAAILGLTRSIATDYAPKLRCVTVSPGAVDTPLLQDEIRAHDQPEVILEQTRNIHLLRRLAQADEVANVIYFVASDKASFVTGHEYRVDGGIGIRLEGT